MCISMNIFNVSGHYHVVVIIRDDLDPISQLNSTIRHHLDLLGLAYCSAIRGVVQVSKQLPSEQYR